jgi:hypothetical protein
LRFVIVAGEINAVTMPRLVSQAISMITLRRDGELIGTAVLERPFAAHRRSQFEKARVGQLAESYPIELG